MKNARFSILEVFGLIGVFAGLLMVAYELRQNSIAAQAQTRATLTVISHDGIRALMVPEMREILLAQAQGTALTDDQQLFLVLNTSMQFRSAENVFYQRRIGTFTESEFSGYLNYYRTLFSRPQVADQWARTRNDYSPDFQADVEELLLL